MILIICSECKKDFEIQDKDLDDLRYCTFCKSSLLKDSRSDPVQVENYILEGINFAKKNLLKDNLHDVIFVENFLSINGFKRAAVWIDSHRDLYLRGLANGFTTV